MHLLLYCWSSISSRNTEIPPQKQSLLPIIIIIITVKIILIVINDNNKNNNNDNKISSNAYILIFIRCNYFLNQNHNQVGWFCSTAPVLTEVFRAVELYYYH